MCTWKENQPTSQYKWIEGMTMNGKLGKNSVNAYSVASLATSG